MRRWFLRGLLLAIAGVLALTLFLLVQLQLGNFHAVVPQELYRTAQPDGHDLARYREKYGIQSVLNLRGGNAGDGWYNEEFEASKQLGIKLIDFRMKAARELTAEQVASLLEVMKNAPKPMLIHCRSGADRTGLAAALYLKHIAGRSEAEASYQLSLRYGHLPFWWTDAQAMDRTWERADTLPVPAP